MKPVTTCGRYSTVSPTRTWIIGLTGVVLIAAAGAGSFVLSRDARTQPTDTSPFPVGLAFTQAEWAKVTTTLTRRGFDPATLRVVSGMRLETPSQPLALVRAASRSRGLCFVPVRGVRPGRATCSSSGHLDKPLLVFAATDRMGGGKATDIVGVARHSVIRVSMIDDRGFESGVALIPSAGGLWSFAGGYGSAKVVVRARLASGRITPQIKLP
jgi:hypothetical protein